ncbi:MAG: DUF1190 domain-containing protein [Hyphomicrobiales bacterium]|nr:DUF1190 domain-containing protein [Hyphomicrobiales bacterium]
MRSAILLTIGLCVLGAGAALAGPTRSDFTYGSASACAAAGRVPADLCANAAANAAAEFDEKTPQFSTRAECEHAFRAGCQIGFSGAAGWRGKKAGLYFTPRQQGFRITRKSERDIAVAPIVAGLTFSARSILHRDTHVDARVQKDAREAWRARDTAPVGALAPREEPPAAIIAGARNPSREKAPDLPAPPKPALEKNFDCAALLEPSLAGDPSTACAPAPRRYWR